MSNHDVILRNAKRVTTDRFDMVVFEAWSFTAYREIRWSCFFDKNGRNKKLNRILKKLGFNLTKDGGHIRSKSDITNEFLSQDTIIGRYFEVDVDDSGKYTNVTFVNEIQETTYRQTEINNERLEWALQYASYGWKVLPLYTSHVAMTCSCYRGTECTAIGKHPLTELVRNGVSQASNDPDVIEHWWNLYPEANVGIATGRESGIFVLDIDGDEGLDSLYELTKRYTELPETPMQNTGGGGMHYIFKYPDGKRTIDSTASVLGDHLDIRGDGGYIVAEPSIHKTRNKYVWDVAPDEVEPAPSPKWLIDEITSGRETRRKKDEPGGAHLNGKITSGNRNNVFFKQASYLRRYGWEKEEIINALMGLNENRCDEPLPPIEIHKIADSACKRYKPQVDLTKVSDPNEMPEDLMDKIEFINEKFAQACIGGTVVYIHERYDWEMKRPAVDYMKRQSFLDYWEQEQVLVPTPDGKEKLMPLGKFWLQSKFKRRYEQVVFNPGGTKGNDYNLWRGFEVDPKEGNIDLYLDHIWVNIANKKEDIYNYVISWMADLIQNPTRKIGTCLVLRGKPGTGKGVFVHAFGSLFNKHYMYVTSNTHLTGNFNSHLKDTLLIFADEAFYAGDKSKESILKSLITEGPQMIEAKFQDAIQSPSYARIIMASNYEWVVPSGPDERRYVVLDVAETHMQDTQYFEKVVDQISSVEGQSALLHYLQNWDCSIVNLRELPRTEALLDQQLESLDSVQSFWFQLLVDGEIPFCSEPWPQEITTNEMYKKYQNFCDGLKLRGHAIVKKPAFIKRIKKIAPSLGVCRIGFGSSRQRGISFMSLEDHRDEFCEHMGTEIDWGSYGSDDTPF